MSLGLLSSGLDATFDINNYSSPKLISQTELAKNIIMFILYSKPGAYPSLPQIGLNIDKYLYEDYETLKVDTIQQQLVEQCSFLEEFFANGSIKLKKIIENNKPTIKIEVNYEPLNEERPTNSYNLGITYDELTEMISDLSEEG